MSDELPKDFDPHAYLALHTDVAKARVNPAKHYIEFGLREGRAYKAADPAAGTMTAEDWRARAHARQRQAHSENPNCPEAFGFRVYSQSDEDGIIAEIFRRIGTTNNVFVEFGAERGVENNCRYLLESGWTGLWIEGVDSFCDTIVERHKDRLDSGQLKLIRSFVNKDNINGFITDSGIPHEIDLLSIDIDSIDYYVWEAISATSARLVVLEHNYDPPPADYVMPYNTYFRWNHHQSGFGSSLVANVRLGKQLGYTLVATGLYSPNGFYVRNDLLGNKFPGPYDAEGRYRDLDYQALVNFPGPPSAGEIGFLDMD
jgi:hypothetical protein